MHYMITLLAVPSVVSLERPFPVVSILSMTTFPDALEAFAQISAGRQSTCMSDSICQDKLYFCFLLPPNPENYINQDLSITLVFCCHLK